MKFIARAFSPLRIGWDAYLGLRPRLNNRTGRWPLPDNGKNNNGRYDLYVDTA